MLTQSGELCGAYFQKRTLTILENVRSAVRFTIPTRMMGKRNINEGGHLDSIVKLLVER